MIKTAVVLCGGRGTRLGFIGKKYAKTLIKVRDKEVLWYIIKFLKKNNFKKIILPLGYKSHQIIKFLKKYKFIDIEIIPIFTGINTSIGKRIYMILKKLNEENFLLLNGDAIFNFDISKICKTHEKKKYAITFLSSEATYQWGTVGVKNNSVIDFQKNFVYGTLGNNTKNYKAYNYSGISIINSKKLNRLKKIILNTKNFEKDIFPKLIKYRANIKNIKGLWVTIDNMKDIDLVNKDVKIGKLILKLKKYLNEK